MFEWHVIDGVHEYTRNGSLHFAGREDFVRIRGNATRVVDV